jgi:tryptophan halogenase
MIRNVLILGGGSAGFLCALALKARSPELPLTLLRSKDLGIIGVGEGTTTTVGNHLHFYCGLDVAEFYRKAEPQWKIGIRFEWGPRPFFNYVFGYELDTKYDKLSRGTGYYINDTEPFEAVGVQSQLMNENKIWLRQPDGRPRIVSSEWTYHLENEKLVAYLEEQAIRRGINIVDDTVTDVMQNEHGIEKLKLQSGLEIAADFYIDASGFRSQLLGQALGEPFYSYKDSLFCDRALIGGWERGPDEPIQPYTTAETMNHGWCWRIDHETRINRGYVFSSSFCSNDEAETEFRAKNPKVEVTRIVPFRSGRYQRFWVKNVAAVGNAAAFVEPLEATALASICLQSQAIAETLADCDWEPNPSTVANFNIQMGRGYDTIRDFLALHYRFNRRIDTPFWRECLEKVDLHNINNVVEFYRENGPSVLWRHTLFNQVDGREFGMEGYLAMLVGMAVPHQSKFRPSAAELEAWQRIRQAIRQKVSQAYTVPEALRLIRSPWWTWPARMYDQPHAARR